MTVLDVFSWLPAKEISIEELEQIFTGHLNGTYEGEYKVLLEVPDNAHPQQQCKADKRRESRCLHFERWKCNCCCRVQGIGRRK